ncbi:MAG TPA: FAD-dependent thymidylate synthase [Terriglobales bacterium]|nr:FAD-dependent thymidylate synthase [Terriglobales bacterium]
MSDENGSRDPKQPASTSVYAIYGVEPEVQAYAMAKYSRSALSMKESLREISEQKAEKFLNTYYFQYGHRSIADLAHIALAIERLSILAAIAVVDEQRWDGQERSTRYQNFSHPDYYQPDFEGNSAARTLFRETIDFLFAEYQTISARMFAHLQERTPRPIDMKQEAYERTLRARAFDVARYLLPLATNTSLGEIVNARTLESQISRLLSDRFPEMRALGESLKEAARNPAYNLNQAAFRELWEKIRGCDEGWGDKVRDLLLKEVRPAPTLVKYAEASPYLMHSREELEAAAAELMAGAAIAPAPPVDLLDDEPLEIELATTLLYEHCAYPYRQIRDRVAALSAAERREIVDLGIKHRGPHDELLRAFNAGQTFRFDILMDIGGFRDLHRHRRCVQIHQAFTDAHGYETPEDLAAAGLRERYDKAMARVQNAVAELKRTADEDARTDAIYVLPLAFRKRTLFKMDLAEAAYISELRTTAAGHFSYRRIAYQMFEAVARRYPTLACHFRVTDVNEPVDLLKR